MTESPPLVRAEGLGVSFHVSRGRSGGSHVVRAVDDVSLTVSRGEILGLVGESGSGKTTLGQVLVGLLRPGQGRVLFDGTDIWTTRGQDRRSMRRRMQIVFQESRGSLNPRMRVESIIGEGLKVQGLGDREERSRRVQEVAAQVGLASGSLRRYPHQFSGGQRQRIGIARALAVQPEFLVADEPVASLDVSVQAQVLNVLLDLRSELGLTYILISHDLAVVERVSTRIAVMYMGKIMELGGAGDVFSQPQVPYTYALLSARPTVPGQERYDRIVLPGDVGQPGAERAGCPFAPRCWKAADVCRQSAPALAEVRPGHWAACHFAGDLGVHQPQPSARVGQDAVP
jgi:peptide/nickel transport system ATP-binding protein/oligopeptide transport system ATP-binding protein